MNTHHYTEKHEVCMDRMRLQMYVHPSQSRHDEKLSPKIPDTVILEMASAHFYVTVEEVW